MAKKRIHQLAKELEVASADILHKAQELGIEVKTASSGLTPEEEELVVRGRQKEDDNARVFLHRGIAARQFQRSFVLAEGVDVGQAIMENGLLHIDLTQSIPETVVQKIKIRRA